MTVSKRRWLLSWRWFFILYCCPEKRSRLLQCESHRLFQVLKKDILTYRFTKTVVHTLKHSQMKCQPRKNDLKAELTKLSFVNTRLKVLDNFSLFCHAASARFRWFEWRDVCLQVRLIMGAAILNIEHTCRIHEHDSCGIAKVVRLLDCFSRSESSVITMPYQ